MESEEQAKVAIAALDGHDFMGVNIDVKVRVSFLYYLLLVLHV